MILPTISELFVHGAFDRGVVNKERIILQANQTVNLGQFGLMLGYKAADGLANPYNDHLFWFGDALVQKGDWIFLYTGPGEPRVDDAFSEGNKIYSLHWGRPTTILAHSDITPILFRVDSVQLAPPPVNLPQTTD